MAGTRKLRALAGCVVAVVASAALFGDAAAQAAIMAIVALYGTFCGANYGEHRAQGPSA